MTDSLCCPGGAKAMSEQFRDELREVVKRHAGDLDADDLRSAAGDLEQTADNWEAMSL